MTRTLLVDLDNTLLRNENSVFIPALIEAFSNALSDLINPSELPDTFLEGTRAMIDNDQPDLLLLEVLVDVLARRTGIETSLLKDRIYKFYADDYRTLKKLTEPLTGARGMMQEAVRRGYRIAIATNPLYPLNAIEQRLEWAGFSSEWFKPDLVASFEHLHFTKPAPAFLAELLAHMGWPEGEVIAIGDDPHNDIRPAQVFGFPAFQIIPESPEWQTDPELPLGCGQPGDFFRWLDRIPPENLSPDFENPQAVEAILRATLAAMDTLLRSASQAVLSYRPASSEWNLTEIICHFRDVEREVQLPRIQQVLEESNPLIVGKSTDEWAEERQYCLQSPDAAFREFYDCRMETLSLLGSLSSDDWRRPARHTIFGPTSLLELTSFAAGHDRLHLNQAWRLKDKFMLSSKRSIDPAMDNDVN
jgi:FMN phosphatase YigB (HAD superfamily)